MSTREPSIDLIQVFCANFPCDIDLGLPPGVNRLRPEIKWPSFDSCASFASLEPFERLIRTQEMEIYLKRSRYSIETIQLVLSSQVPAAHLVEAVQKHYAVHSYKESFRTDHVVRALSELELIPVDAERERLANIAGLKFEQWLLAAIDKCRGLYV
jgi:hypothetical protein